MTSVRAKLFLLSFALVVSGLLVAEWFFVPALAENVTEVAHAHLLYIARLTAQEAAGAPGCQDTTDLAAWDQLADQIGSAAHMRVSFVRPDGTVLGDSETALDGLSRAANLRREPEIETATSGGEGVTDRTRPASSERVAYVAAPVQHNGAIVAVARIAEPLSRVDGVKADARRYLWFGAAIVLALAFAASHFVAAAMGASVKQITGVARRMAEGDLSVRTQIDEQDEFGGLRSALDRMASSLTTMLEQLRAERDLQSRILEAMQEGVVVVDREGHIVLVNSALRSMLLLGAESVGKLLIEAVRHSELDDLLDDARNSHDSPPAEIELPGLKPRRLLVHASPLLGDDERLLVVFVDVTELRRLESHRREFVANASHELRTPIAAVRSATETLRSGALGDPVAAARFVDIIERNAQRLQSLVEDMLDLSKLESREFRLKRERVELASVVPIVLALFRERAEKKGVRLRAELPASPLAIEGDARGLEHVLSNLVDNAVKYCPAGSTIVVRGVREGDRVRLVVSDTGPGIPPEHLPRLFERFYRVDAGRSRELGGTGLGLSIVKHMVEAMRGAVSVESTVGKGSTFTVSLSATKV